MKRIFGNIRMVLFLTYSLIIIIVFSFLVGLFYLWSSQLLRNNAIQTLQGLGDSVQEQINSEIDKMNTVSLDVIYSNLVKERFQRYKDLDSANDADESDHTLYPQSKSSLPLNMKALTEVLTAIIGPSRPVEQIYLYTFDGRAYGNGFDNRERHYSQHEKPQIQRLLDEPINKIVDRPVADQEMSRYVSSQQGLYSMSLYRLFFDEYNIPIGVVEVKQYFNRIFRSANEYLKSNTYEGEVFVFDKDGKLLYPTPGPVEAEEQYGDFLTLDKQKESYRSIPYRNPQTGVEQLLSIHYSKTTGWHTVLVVSEKELFKPLAAFTKNIFYGACILLVIGMGLSLLAANKITLPIYRMHRVVRNFSFEHIGSTVIAQQDMNSGLNEIDELYNGFQHMSNRLKQSLDDLLLAESQQLQSRLNALQSQMNPHFLYNSLANIQEMAEQRMNPEIVVMIDNMSDFLRYISADTTTVALREELDHTSSYVAINQVRFGSKLQFSYDVDEAMLEQVVPKLIIQPLVENAVKYATLQSPPWEIKVIGTMLEEQWQVEVTDNGEGINDNALQQLYQRIEQIEQHGELPSLELGGMGFLNIYMRLSLMYGEHKIFRITTNEHGGASIFIGGPLQRGGSL